MNNPGFQ